MDIPFAMQWWSRVKPLMKADLRAKCGEVRAKVTTHMYKFEIPVEPHFCAAVRTELNLVVTGNPNLSQINSQFPAITVESSPERSARLQTYGSMVDAVKEAMSGDAMDFDIIEDWRKTLSIRVKSSEGWRQRSVELTSRVMSCGRRIIPDLRKLGWSKTDLELGMRK